MAISSSVFAINIPQKLIISGQVLNINYGNPIEGHSVIIENSRPGSERYYKEVQTDKEGYYYDTIFATNSKGKFKISTKNFNNGIHDTIVHYRFMSLASYNVIIANFNIYVPYHPEAPQSKFKFYPDDNGNRLKYFFKDLTVSENVLSWEWNFGDGETSTEQNPVHIYNETGVFKVLFTVTFNIKGIITTNTITGRIYISESLFFHIGGHAFTEYFPVDKGLTYLYLIDSLEQYIPVDTVQIDTLGFYLFYQIPVGDYVIKTQPANNSVYYGEMMPTYYGNIMYWEDAEIIHHNSTSWEYDIHMMHLEEMPNGKCSLDGNVTYGNLGSSIMDLPAKNVDLYLFDNNNNLLASHYSNEEGFFDFSNLHTGTYWIYPEITGVICDTLQIILSDEDPNATGIEIIIGPTGPDFIFNNKFETNIISNLFPNPTNSTINVEFELNNHEIVVAEILDLQGRIVFSQQTENFVLNGKLSINISNLKKGTYILNLRSGSFTGRKLFVVNN